MGNRIQRLCDCFRVIQSALRHRAAQRREFLDVGAGGEIFSLAAHDHATQLFILRQQRECAGQRLPHRDIDCIELVRIRQDHRGDHIVFFDTDFRHVA